MKAMKSTEVLALGEYKPEDLIVSVSESTRKTEPAIENQLETIWEAKKKKAAPLIVDEKRIEQYLGVPKFRSRPG